jgi:LPXTG-motif cell wall-anchored protein
MKRLSLIKILTLGMAVLTIAALLVTPAMAAGPRVRAVHASPDAPAVDVWVDGKPAFQNATFKAITPYAALAAGEHKLQVVPAGQTSPAVISTTLTLADNKDYTVIALGKLANIAPLVLEDNNSAPAAGKAHVRFVHASPDAPAVDIAVKGGLVVFKNVAFKGVGDYTPVDAGTYDLQVRLAGTDTVALDVPGVKLADGGVYTIFAMGLAGGEPKLVAVPSVDRAPAQAAGPTTLPTTGGESNPFIMALILASMLIIAGFSMRRPAPVPVRVCKDQPRRR